MPPLMNFHIRLPDGKTEIVQGHYAFCNDDALVIRRGDGRGRYPLVAAYANGAWSKLTQEQVGYHHYG